jgi:hypothetical protein
MADYKIGTADPTITPDPGAGAWGSKSASAEILAQYESMKIALGINTIARFMPILGPASDVSRTTIITAIGDDAVKHLEHYLRNTGKDYTIDLEGMINEVPRASTIYKSELSQAIKFVQGLSPGTHNITSGKATSGYNYQSESKNWFFAVGGYSVWGKGVAKVTDKGKGIKECSLEYKYKFFDRYNWDTGKSVTIPYINMKIEDKFMGEFHRCGLAKEFNMYGSVKRSIKWDSNAPPAATIDLGKMKSGR